MFADFQMSAGVAALCINPTQMFLCLEFVTGWIEKSELLLKTENVSSRVKYFT